jgi:uncharacterized protein (TIGR00299 family) protein
MTKALVLDPFSGISGDMFLGALVDLDVSFDTLTKKLSSIPELSKVTAKADSVQRGVFAATQIVVTCPKETIHRHLSTIRGIIDKADLPDAVKRGATATFTRLAEAEAKVHGHDIEKVHFHEVGALDAIFDIIGAHVALDLLGNPTVFARPIVLGAGTTTSDHGEIPLPAPATLELLAGHRVKFSERMEELVTPTGAAIIAATATPLDDNAFLTPERVGYGAGSREREGLPNVLRVILGEVTESPAHVCIMTSTIDDMNPEMYGYVMEQLFKAGALEVYYNSIMMKKNRPGLEVTVIGEERDVNALCDWLMANTTTLGVRVHREERVELARRRESVETPYGTIDIKVATRPGGAETMSPEYESCKAAAEREGVGLMAIYDAARKAWEDKHQQ